MVANKSKLRGQTHSKDMATDDASTSFGKVPWHWFEQSAYRKAHSTVSSQEIDDYLERRWKELPQNYKDHFVPALSELYEAGQKLEHAEATSKNTVCIGPEDYEGFKQTDFDNYVDGFATVDERIAVLRSLQSARKHWHSAVETLMQARTTYANQELLSVEGASALETAHTSLGYAASVAKEELERWQALAPQLRQVEADWRLSRRVAGLPSGPGWVGSWRLGSGSYGVANLWLRQDSDGHIVDRLVVKDAAITDSMIVDDNAWVLHDGVYIPTEVFAPRLLAGKEGSETVLKIRGWRDISFSGGFRILMDFYPFGDMFDLRMKPYRPMSFDPAYPQLPQPFLWYTFECLAIAGVLMHQGALHPQALSGWQQIYHNDIKLGNMMLGAPNPNSYPGYPSPVMVDFGLAQLCPAGEQHFGRGGTATCSSPENLGGFVTLDDTECDKLPLTHKSDVWSVGNVIYSLVLASEGDGSLNFLDDPSPREPDLQEFKGHYNPELLTLIADCMRYYPEDRIGFVELLERIRMHTGGHLDPRLDLVKGLRRKEVYNQLWQHPAVRLRMPNDKWQLYSKLAPRVPDRAIDAAYPPNNKRRFSPEMEYKGPFSADTTNLQHREKKRKHAAEHSRMSHLRWLQKERKKELMRKQGTLVDPDSNDDEEDGGRELRGAEKQNTPEGEQTVGVANSFERDDDAAFATAVAASQDQAEADMDAETSEAPGQTRPQRPLSRSAAAGAAEAQHQPAEDQMEVEHIGSARRTRSYTQARSSNSAAAGAALQLQQQDNQTQRRVPRTPSGPQQRGPRKRSCTTTGGAQTTPKARLRDNSSSSPDNGNEQNTMTSRERFKAFKAKRRAEQDAKNAGNPAYERAAAFRDRMGGGRG